MDLVKSWKNGFPKKSVKYQPRIYQQNDENIAQA